MRCRREAGLGGNCSINYESNVKGGGMYGLKKTLRSATDTKKLYYDTRVAREETALRGVQ